MLSCSGEELPETHTVDRDRDGHSAVYTDGELVPELSEDCDDDSSKTHPGAEEICDGEDNDCDGEVDEGLLTVEIPSKCYRDQGSCRYYDYYNWRSTPSGYTKFTGYTDHDEDGVYAKRPFAACLADGEEVTQEVPENIGDCDDNNPRVQSSGECIVFETQKRTSNVKAQIDDILARLSAEAEDPSEAKATQLALIDILLKIELTPDLPGYAEVYYPYSVASIFNYGEDLGQRDRELFAEGIRNVLEKSKTQSTEELGRVPSHSKAGDDCLGYKRHPFSYAPLESACVDTDYQLRGMFASIEHYDGAAAAEANRAALITAIEAVKLDTSLPSSAALYYPYIVSSIFKKLRDLGDSQAESFSKDIKAYLLQARAKLERNPS